MGLPLSLVFATALGAATPASPPTPPGAAAQAASVVPVQGRVCSRRMGPYVTNQTAFNRRATAMRQGFRVSGTFHCGGGGTGRGYCFRVFFAC